MYVYSVERGYSTAWAKPPQCQLFCTRTHTVLYAAVVVLPLTLISVLLVKRAAAIHTCIATAHTAHTTHTAHTAHTAHTDILSQFHMFL